MPKLNPAERASLAAWIKLCSTSGLGGESQRKLMQAFGMPEQVLAMGRTALRSVVAEKADLLFDTRNDALIEKTLDWAEQPGQHLIHLGDPRYPTSLLEIPDPPSLLYVRGNPDQLKKPGIAIVGSRHASTGGKQTAKAFSSALSKAGLSVISGLALGIDAAAHEGALPECPTNKDLALAGGTLAVIGTGADRLYPASHRKLAEQIESYGAIVSEFPLGTPALPANFPRRNRIISGLSRAVLVVEAALESGSLVTARMAIEQGREVMAIPGSIHSPLSRGCHRLIKQGAKLVETVDDILEEIGHIRPRTPIQRETAQALIPLTTIEQAILAHIEFSPTLLDQIVSQSGQAITDVLGALLTLEMKGLISTMPGDCYQRIATY